MKSTLSSLLIAASVVALLSSTSLKASTVDPNALLNFSSSTGLDTTEGEISEIWNALTTLGTNEFLGGNIGSFQIDEGSLIAGALAIGASELDNFLRTGSLNVSTSDIGQSLSEIMSGGSGVDMSYLTGSFTNTSSTSTGLPFATSASLTSSTGAAQSAGQCDAGIASKQVAVGLKGVQNVVDAASTDQYGFSKNKALSAGQSDSGFAARGCLDKLFQNSGSDVLFKPPSLGNLTTMLSGWSCDAAVSVEDQIAGQFGDMSLFETSSMGGFFPSGVFGEANDGATPVRPGIGNTLSEVFGTTFDEENGNISTELSSLSSVFN